MSEGNVVVFKECIEGFNRMDIAALLRLMHPDLPRGLASIHILVLFGIGLQSLLLGIVGEYLLRIYLILRGEPVAIVENSLNFAHDDLKL